MDGTSAGREGMDGMEERLSGIMSCPESLILPSTAGIPTAGGLSPNASAQSNAEFKLVRRVYTRCDGFIQEACHSSSVRPEFLGALTANESGGDNAASRFEPSVYRHLKAVAAGESPHYGAIRAQSLCEQLAGVLHPKTGEFHERFLNSLFTPGPANELSRLADEALRELASSWGLVQIMGFHVIGRRGAVRDLVDPRFHYHVANQLLAEFAASYELDLGREFEELFRCWNSGRPDGQTADPAYVRHGLMRIEIYRALMSATCAGDTVKAGL